MTQRLFGFLLIYGAAGCGIEAPERAEPAAVVGRVLSYAGPGQPVAGAGIELAAGGNAGVAAVSTDASGRYRIDGLEPESSVVLRASMPGWVPAASAPLLLQGTLVEGEDTDLRMMEQSRLAEILDVAGVSQDPGLGMLAGELRDTAGQPVSGMQLELVHRLATQTPKGPYYLEADGTLELGAGATGPSGRFIWFNVPLGHARVTSALREITLPEVPQWSLPGTLSFARIRMEVGSPVIDVEGQVFEAGALDEAGEPVPVLGVEVSAVGRSGVQGRSDARGSFLLSGLPGQSRLVLSAFHALFADAVGWPIAVGLGAVSGEAATLRLPRRDRFEELASTLGLQSNDLAGLVAVGGEVTDRSGTPIVGATVQLADSNGGPVSPTGGVLFPDGDAEARRTGRGGEFYFLGVPAGPLRLSVSAEALQFPEVVDVEGVAGRLAFGRVRATGNTPRVTLRGRVVPVGAEENGYSGATVRFERPLPAEALEAASGADGGFELPEVPADSILSPLLLGESLWPTRGEDVVVPRGEGEGLLLHAVTRGFAGNAARRAEVTIDEAAALVVGRVVDAEGAPVEGARLVLAPRPGTDANGRSNGPWFFAATGLLDPEATVTGPGGRFILFNQPDGGELAIAAHGPGEAASPELRVMPRGGEARFVLVEQ